jgi:hypothetical protein
MEIYFENILAVDILYIQTIPNQISYSWHQEDENRKTIRKRHQILISKTIHDAQA